ncbi:MAG: OmpH family outer membrane protein [Bacteroidetes bacterium]|nr:OmpH family outer membrane protein [Bacteroidota bacterium]
MSLVCLVTAVLYLFNNNQNIKYVEEKEIFEKFEMKKKFESQLSASSSERDKVLDSVSLELKLMDQKLKSKNNQTPANIELFRMKEREYYLKKKALEEDNQRQISQYDQQIWAQLNQYISDYGKNNHIDLIIGAKGDGTVMHGSDKLNITKEVLEYCNNRYRGNK